MNQPVSMVCGHSACKACLEMVSKSLQGNGKTCPLCRETITLRKMNTNLAVRAMIAKILVHCINSGCAWTGSMTRCKITAPFVPSRLSRALMVPRKATDRMPWISTWQPVHFRKSSVHFVMFKGQDSISTHTGNCPEGPRVCPLHCGDEMPR